MPLWGHDCPLPALAALASLSLAGYGLVHSQLALLSPLFCEHAWKCLQFSLVAQSRPTLCNAMNHSLPDLPVYQKFLELLKLMPIQSVMPSSHLILCRPLLLLPPIPPSIRVFSN